MKTLSIKALQQEKQQAQKKPFSLRKTWHGALRTLRRKRTSVFRVEEKQFAKLLYTPDAYLVTIDYRWQTNSRPLFRKHNSIKLATTFAR